MGVLPRSILGVYFKYTSRILIIFIGWFTVYPEIEVLSFNGEVKHEKLVLPAESV